MFKNVASQKIQLFAFDTTTGAPKTGDAANITAYVAKDYGTVTVLGDTSATEMDATNAKGWYLFDLTQGETNADCLLFTAKSSTSNISIVGQVIYTLPASFTSFVTPTNLTAAQIATGVWQDTTAGDFTTALSVGKSVMNGVALGTGLTVNDITTKTGYSLSVAGVSAVWQDTTAGDFTAANSIGKSIMNGVALGTGLTINAYTGNTAQTGDSFARIGAPAGASISADIAAAKVDTAAIKVQTDKMAFTVTNVIDANMLRINGDAVAAADLAQASDTIVRGTCSGGTTTTAVVSALVNPSSLTDAGQLLGRTIIFKGSTGTANVQGQASTITNSTTGSTPTITFAAITTAPANGDIFVVV